MTKKEQIIELLEKYGNETDLFKAFIIKDEFSDLAEDLVKLFAIPDVMAMLPDINEFENEAEQFANGGFSTEDEKYAYITAWQECRQWLVDKLKGN